MLKITGIVDIKTAAEQTGVPATMLRALVESGDIPHIRVHRKPYIKIAAVEAVIHRLLDAASQPTSVQVDEAGKEAVVAENVSAAKPFFGALPIEEPPFAVLPGEAAQIPLRKGGKR